MVYYTLKIPLFAPKERDSNDDFFFLMRKKGMEASIIVKIKSFNLFFFFSGKNCLFVVVQFCRILHSREPLVFILTSANQSSIQAVEEFPIFLSVYDQLNISLAVLEGKLMTGWCERLNFLRMWII